MKLFLASSFDKTISIFLKKWEKPASATTVLFIANAADPYHGDKFWVRNDREAFTTAGFRLQEIDLRQTTREQFVQQLSAVEIVHICGGSVLYFISLLRKLDLAVPLIEAVKSGKVVYTGTSAGAMIVADDLKPCSYDQEEMAFVKGMTNFSGLGLVRFLILPHCNQELFIESNTKVVEHLPKHPQPFVLLHDNQAVWVDGDKMEIVIAPV